jgi:transposase
MGVWNDAGMRDTELYERLLGLKEPWKVKAVKMDVEGRRVEVEVECAERTIWASPESRQRLHIHGWERRSWRHLDTCGFATVITAEVPRVKDEKGQTETVAVPWAEKFSRFTRTFEAFGVEVLRAARSLSDACELLSLSWDQAHRIMERAVARGLERRCLEELHAVGIDEKSFLSGQSYLSVLSDPKGSRVLEVTEGRERASAERLFESVAPPQRQKVEAVVMDMSAAFQAASEAKMPQAEIVHDRFHVAKHLNEAVDKVRRTEHRELQGEGEETLKGSKFLFLFAPENLDRERRARLRELLNSDLKVGRAWTLKEQFRHFWERANARTALSFFEQWYARAVRSRLKPMIAAAKMLKRHLLNLLNYHHYRLTNATAEGLNSRIQAIKADARGFRSFHNFRTRILFFLGKLDLSPA